MYSRRRGTREPTIPKPAAPEQPSGAVARDHQPQHDRIAERLASHHREQDRYERTDQQHRGRREDEQRAKCRVAPDERDRLAQPGTLRRGGDGARTRNADQPRDDEGGERERGHRHPQRPAHVEGGDEEAGDRSSEQVADVLRRGEQGVRSLAPVPAGVRRRWHQALPRGRPGRVGQCAENGQQHDVPDLQRVEREEDRQRRDGEPAQEVGNRARTNRTDRVHDPTGRQATDGGARDAGEDRDPGERGAAGRGQHEPRNRDRHDDVAAQRHGVRQDQEPQRRRESRCWDGHIGHGSNDPSDGGESPTPVSQ
jgi:hypothetical protein